MKGTLKIKVGDKVLELTAEGSGKDLMKGFSFWSSLPSKCGLCGSGDISLSHKSPKGNDYFGLRCLKCSAEINFGQLKTGGGFFLRGDNKWEKWEPNKNPEDSDSDRSQNNAASNKGSAQPQQAADNMW